MDNLNYIENFATAIVDFYETSQEFKKIYDLNNNFKKVFIQNSDLVPFFGDWTINKNNKKVLLLNLLGLINCSEENYKNGFLLFLDHNHGLYIESLIHLIQKKLEAKLNIKKAYVSSSAELTPEQKVRLEKSWNEKFKTSLTYSYHVDPRLKLGIKVKVDDYVEDYTLKAQLKKIKEKISKDI